MKCVAFCSIGFEDVLLNDVKEILNIDGETNKGCVIFDAKNEDIIKFAYKCQSIESIGLLLKQGIIKEDITEVDITNIDFNIIKKTFSFSCSINGQKKFNSNEVSLFISKKIKEITKKEAVYKNADVCYNMDIIDDDYYIYLNFVSKELSKRDYKIFVNKTSLRGNIAYCTAKLAGIDNLNKEIKVLDPFCRSGEIPIEIMHYVSGKSINQYTKEIIKIEQLDSKINLEKYDKIKESKIKMHASDSNMPNLKAAEKNSKIAGLNKMMNFSRILIEDLDLKFSKEIDMIITQLPALGKENEKRVLEIYRQFFEVCPKILNKNGSITCIGLNITQAITIAEHNGFKMKHKREIMQGKELLNLFIFK
jgi:23S rRNA G2445 N2-methylase RlmL